MYNLCFKQFRTYTDHFINICLLNMPHFSKSIIISLHYVILFAGRLAQYMRPNPTGHFNYLGYTIHKLIDITLLYIHTNHAKNYLGLLLFLN